MNREDDFLCFDGIGCIIPPEKSEIETFILESLNGNEKCGTLEESEVNPKSQGQDQCQNPPGNECLICSSVHHAGEPKSIKKTDYSRTLSCLLQLDSSYFREKFHDAEYCKPCQSDLYSVYNALEEIKRLQIRINHLRDTITQRIMASSEKTGRKSTCGFEVTSKSDEFRKEVTKMLQRNVEKNVMKTNLDSLPANDLSLKKFKQKFPKRLVVCVRKLSKEEILKYTTPTSNSCFDNAEQKKEGFETSEIKDNDCRLDSNFEPGNTEGVSGGYEMCESANKHKTSKPKMHRILASEQRQQKYLCRDRGCKFSFMTEDIRDAHFKKRHLGIKKPYDCSECGRSFATSTVRNTHMFTHKKVKDVICEECGKGFVSKIALWSHKNAVHTDRPLFHCNECKNAYKSENSLEVHKMLAHTQDFKHFCNVCGLGFPTTTALKIHMSHHDPEDPMKCKDCGKQFNKTYDMKIHRMKHTGQYAYYCQVCNLGCQTKGVLDRHILIHDDLKRYECDICNKKFRHDRSMKIHKRIHTNDRRHVCEVCGKAFMTRQKLFNHMRIHTGEHPFECHICHKKFKHDNYLKKHLAYHQKAEEEGRTLKVKANFTKKNTLIPADSILEEKEQINGAQDKNAPSLHLDGSMETKPFSGPHLAAVEPHANLGEFHIARPIAGFPTGSILMPMPITIERADIDGCGATLSAPTTISTDGIFRSTSIEIAPSTIAAPQFAYLNGVLY